jgi:tetratricopeptide (TPR) repeat protein
MSRRERRIGANSGVNRPKIGANTVRSFYEAGFAHFRAERWVDAQICCQQALHIDPTHADTLHLLGLLSFRAGRHDHAVEWFSGAIRRDPKPDYLSNLGVTLKQMGRLHEALQVFDKATQLKPEDAELWKRRGGILVALNRAADALFSYQQALNLAPRLWEAAFNSAILLHQAERFEEALINFNLCDELQPDHALTLQMRSRSLRSLNRLDECLADNVRAHRLAPSDPTICGNIGDALLRLGRFEEALPWLNESLQLRPDSAATISDTAVALAELRRFDEALASYRQALTIDPEYAIAGWNLALLQLLTGDFAAGWAGREARWKLPVLSDKYPKLTQPIWLGAETGLGKTILVCSDEGLGDTIQFARYVPILAAQGARVILMVQDSLCPLLSGLTGVSQCLPLSAATLPAYDYHCPMTSLPLALGTRLDTIPAKSSYLPPQEASSVLQWEERLGAHSRLRIGLVWSGNPKHHNDRNRSIPLRLLDHILNVDATFVSLQKDVRPGDKALLVERGSVIDLTDRLVNFAETAALISCLDLVIAVDTSVAHLAGALGCPTWILLPYTPDWRWLLDRDDSPWYPTVRLFRQNADRTYEHVMEQLRGALSMLIIDFKPPAKLDQDQTYYE